jgi:radical SAM protein with 4Fe4S-binding SPASM domain
LGVLAGIAAMGTPVCVLTGGDPLERADLEDLIRRGKSLGLRMGAIPAATANLTASRMRSLKEAGLDQVALSLDAPEAALHDEMRGVEGSFRKTLEGAAFAREAGLPLQINTCLCELNFPALEAMARRVSSLGIVFWEVFFLVPIGRGSSLKSIRARDFETAFDFLHRFSSEAGFVVKLTEAPHFRRFLAERKGSAGSARAPIGLSRKAVNSGKGFLFIDHKGAVCPSGFLPLEAGNARSCSLAEIYRESPLFLDLRDASKLKGKCRACRYAEACGGSRARAYAVTGDYLASEPFCAYEPGQLVI